MNSPPAAPGAAGLVLEAVARRRAASACSDECLVVAVDGHGGSGKSTVTELVRRETGAAVLPMDAFFHQPGPRAAGHAQDAQAEQHEQHEQHGQDEQGEQDEQDAQAEQHEQDEQDEQDEPDLADYYDYGRLRAEGLEPLREGRPALFAAWDWHAGRPGDPLRVDPARLVLLDGVSSGSPLLADLVDLAVFVETPEGVRLERLHARLSDDEWDERWLDAERRYFETRPASSFDLIVPGTSAL